MSTIIAVTDLVKSFKGNVAVDGVSFTVPEGVCFGLLGPNGAGKTTTIEMLEGILKPSSGQLKLFGQQVNKALFQRVGIQFQNTALPDQLTVKETLKLFASLYPKSANLTELIELCALNEFINQDARRLSGGQRQRLLLALALINDPDLVFLDEPTTGLDPHARRNFWYLIEAIKKRGKTVILTTHYMDEAQVLCDDIAIMDKGKIIERGAPSELLQRHFRGVFVRLPIDERQAQLVALGFTEHLGYLELRTDAVQQVLLSLIDANIALHGMQVHNPNLEDLFLKLTGHVLRG